MSYATVADMVARFGALELIQLTDVDNIPPSTIDEARVELKLEDASSFIDGYVGQVYRLPLLGCRTPMIPGQPVEYAMPPVLVRMACDVARYYLHDDLAPENEVYRRYKAVLAELDAIALGKSMLSCPWGGSPGVLVAADAQQGTDVHFDFSPRAVTDDTLRGFG